MSPTKRRRSSSEQQAELALAGRTLQACDLCGKTHWCTGLPAPTNSPIKKCRIGIPENTYTCICKVCKKGYKQKTIPDPGHSDLELPGFSCLSSLLIYAFICEHPDCSGAVKYVGSTTQQLQARIASITPEETTLSVIIKNFTKTRPKLPSLRLIPMGRIQENLTRECYLTKLFQTLASHGKGGLQIRGPHGRRCSTCKQLKMGYKQLIG